MGGKGVEHGIEVLAVVEHAETSADGRGSLTERIVGEADAGAEVDASVVDEGAWVAGVLGGDDEAVGRIADAWGDGSDEGSGIDRAGYGMHGTARSADDARFEEAYLL